MLDQLVTQFLASDTARDVVPQVVQQTELDEAEARAAVQATAEGAAEATQSGSGLADLAGSFLGGGGAGLGGLAGSLLGGGEAPGGPPAALVETVTRIVADKTGLSPSIAGVVVNLVLPKILAYFQGQQG